MKKKILIVNSFYYPTIVGGAEISTKLLAEGLLADNYEVHVITTGPQRSELVKEVVEGITVYRLPCKNLYWPVGKQNRSSLQKLAWHFINAYNPLQSKLLKQVINDIKPDIIHTQNLSGIGTYIWNIAHDLGIPIAHTTRDYALFQPVNSQIINKFLSSINRKRSRYVNHAVGISNFILEKHKAENLFPNSKFSIIHNVVKSEKYARKQRKEGDPISLGYFGQLEENKGIKMLIEVFQELDKEVASSFIICGAGSMEGEIRELGKADKRINFKGKLSQKEVYKTMAQVDVTVVPSIWEEPFGRIIIESYAQGTPVIASAVGGIPEIIANRSYLFPNEDRKALEEMITKFQKSTNENIANEIKISFQESIKYSENIKTHINLYETICDS